MSFGHLRNGDGQSVWLPALDDPISAIYLFHMPLFFFLGGLTFSSRKPFKQFITRKVQTLLVPYYVFSLYFLAKPVALLIMPNLARTLQSGHDYSIWAQFYDVLINGSGLWFLWAYFVGELIVYGLTKLIESRTYDAYLGIVLIIGYLAVHTLTPALQLPFRILQGVEVAGFILLGMACKPIFSRLSFKISTIVMVVSTGFFLCAAALIMSGSVFSLEKLAVSVLGMFTGVTAATLLAVVINKNWVLELIGKNSIIFYCVNALMLNVGKIVFFRILPINGPGLNVVSQWIMGILVTTFCLGLMWATSFLVHKWFPWSIGAGTRSQIGLEADQS